MNQIIAASDRALLDAVSLALIPAGHEGPSAKDVHISEHVKKVLNIRPDLATNFFAILRESAGKDPELWARALQKSDAARFAELCYVIVAAYTISPEARTWLNWERLGGEFEIRTPISDEEVAELLIPVVQRGPRYRATDWKPTG